VPFVPEKPRLFKCPQSHKLDLCLPRRMYVALSSSRVIIPLSFSEYSVHLAHHSTDARCLASPLHPSFRSRTLYTILEIRNAFSPLDARLQITRNVETTKLCSCLPVL